MCVFSSKKYSNYPLLEAEGGDGSHTIAAQKGQVVVVTKIGGYSSLLPAFLHGGGSCDHPAAAARLVPSDEISVADWLSSSRRSAGTILEFQV